MNQTNRQLSHEKWNGFWFDILKLNCYSRSGIQIEKLERRIKKPIDVDRIQLTGVKTGKEMIVWDKQAKRESEREIGVNSVCLGVLCLGLWGWWIIGKRIRTHSHVTHHGSFVDWVDAEHPNVETNGSRFWCEKTKKCKINRNIRGKKSTRKVGEDG